MSSRIWTGLVFIIIGLGFFLQQADIITFGNIFYNFWPLIIIIVGIIQLANRTRSSVMSGFFVIIIGVIFFFNQWMDLNLIKFIWPIAIIYVGINVIFSRSRDKYKVQTDSTADASAIFAGTDIRNDSDSFTGGHVSSIFGSVNYDMRDVTISGNEATIELTTVFGEVKLTVPDNVKVEISGLPIFGECNDKRYLREKEEYVAILKVKHTTVFGSIIIDN